MVRARFHGINRVKKRLADGSVRLHHYHRATGIALPGAPGSPEFIAAYAEAEKQTQNRHAGTVNGLIRDYCLSPEWDRLRDSTRKEYRRMLIKLEASFGDMPIVALDSPRVRKIFLDWRSEIAKKSGLREADNRLSVLSSVLTWARDNGAISYNHVTGFKRLHRVDRSEKLWLPEHITAFMAVAPIELRRALILALHTGQRQADLLRLTWTNIEAGRISIRQGKTGRRIDIRMTRALETMLETIPRTDALVLLTKTGRPWQARHFKSQWLAASQLAGLEDLHFHDLRGTAVTMLAEAGCSIAQIASITGHSLRSVDSILERYLARTRHLADEAITLFENATSTKFANRLQTGGTAQNGRGSK